MTNFIDLTGKRFGRLIALKRDGVTKGRKVVWACRCDCGRRSFVAGTDLCNGHTRSCGCLRRKSY